MTDRQNRVGYKNSGLQTDTDVAIDRRERLRRLAMETVDLSKDPYLMRNHVGTFECRLCLTVHANEGSYLAHTQGKKHQVNLARRQLREKQLAQAGSIVPGSLAGQVGEFSTSSSTAVPVPHTQVHKKTGGVKIGRPGYRVTKQRDPKSQQKSLLFEIELPSIEKGIVPKHRFMSTYEQKIEPADPRFQFLLIAAAPYETIGFKVPAMNNTQVTATAANPTALANNQQPLEVDRNHDLYHEHWDSIKKKYTVQVLFKLRETKALPSLPEQTRTTNLAFHGGGGFVR